MRGLRRDAPGRSRGKVRLPGALPFFFTGLRHGVVARVIAAVVAEYFGGLQNGLGTRITSAAANTAYPRAWAFVVGAMPARPRLLPRRRSLLERLAMPWRQARRPPATQPRPNRADTTMRRRMSTHHRVAGGARRAVGVAGARAAGCSDDDGGADEPATSRPSGGELTTVKLQLQWFTQAQFAGYFAAVDQGFYEDAGPRRRDPRGRRRHRAADRAGPGQRPTTPSRGCPRRWQSREQGAGITDVAQIFQRSGTLQVVVRGQGHHRPPADLEGKKVGNWGFGNEFELFAGMTKAGLDPARTSRSSSSSSTCRRCSSGDIDAAQAMTYNEYAQVLEAENPDTGELYTPDDFTVIDWNDEGTAMLQDAIWANTEKLDDDQAYQDTDGQVPQGVASRAGSTAATTPRSAATSSWPQGSQARRQPPAVADERDQQARSGRRPDGIGIIDEAAWDQTVEVALDTKNAEGATVLTQKPDGRRGLHQRVRREGARRAEGRGRRRDGRGLRADRRHPRGGRQLRVGRRPAAGRRSTSRGPVPARTPTARRDGPHRIVQAGRGRCRS